MATAWVSAHGYRYIPILGARKVSQIEDTMKSTEVELAEEHLAALDELSGIKLGFPHDFLNSEGVKDVVYGEVRTRIDGR